MVTNVADGAVRVNLHPCYQGEVVEYPGRQGSQAVTVHQAVCEVVVKMVGGNGRGQHTPSKERGIAV